MKSFGRFESFPSSVFLRVFEAVPSLKFRGVSFVRRFLLYRGVLSPVLFGWSSTLKFLARIAYYVTGSFWFKYLLRTHFIVCCSFHFRRGSFFCGVYVLMLSLGGRLGYTNDINNPSLLQMTTSEDTAHEMHPTKRRCVFVVILRRLRGCWGILVIVVRRKTKTITKKECFSFTHTQFDIVARPTTDTTAQKK